MTPGKRSNNPQDDQESDAGTVQPLGELPDSRKARLWLGYSEDSLRKRQSEEPRPSQGQGEKDLPTPNDRAHGEQNSGGRRPQFNSIESHLAPNNREDGKEDYNIPDDYANIDELAAPSPVASPGKEREQGYLEDRKRSDAVEDNLDELAIPSPIANPQKEREQGYLEDRTSGFPSSDEKGKQEIPPQRQRASKLVTEIYTISYLIFFSILGTLARLGLQALAFYPGAPVQTGLLWANFGGSLIMGFLSEDRKLFREEWASNSSQRPKANDEEKGKRLQRSPSADKRHTAVKKTWPLYIGLATGFCGSFTSFSSFMRDAFFALSNALKVPISHPSSTPISETINVHRNPGYSFLAVLAVLITTVGLSLMALQLGAHTALFLEPFIPSIPFLFIRKAIDRSFVFIGWGCWLAAIFMAIFPPDRPGGPVGDASSSQETWRSQALFALVFAPPGCLLRFYASLHLNGRIKAFPLGTFAVNIFGTAMEAMFLDLERVPIGGTVGCQVLQGMSDGFCGCLTTVSTWVAELTGLRLNHAYFYGVMSVGVALSLMVIVMGSLQWTNGFENPLCVA